MYVVHAYVYVNSQEYIHRERERERACGDRQQRRVVVDQEERERERERGVQLVLVVVVKRGSDDNVVIERCTARSVVGVDGRGVYGHGASVESGSCVGGGRATRG